MILKKIFLFTFILAALSCGVFAQNGKTGAVDWVLDADGVLTISGEGEMNNYKLLSSTPWETQKGNIKKVIVKAGVTNIGKYAFRNCTALKAVEIPSTVTIIGSNAFYECSSLEELDIPDGVKIIEGDAFYKCSSLKKLVLGNSVERIDGSIIFGCDDLKILISKNVTPPETKSKFLSDTFLGAPIETCTVIIAENSEAAYRKAKGWKNFKRFDKKSDIQQFVQTNPQPSSPKPNVQSTSQPSMNVEENGGTDGNVKWKINDKSELYISGSGKMNDYSSDPLFTKVPRAPWYSHYPELRAGVGGNKWKCYVKKVFIADLESIGKFAFYDCENLSYVSIPNTVQSIGAQAFSVTPSLKSIVIPNSVKYIGLNAFNRTGLTYVVIPSSVTQIDAKAFNSSELDSISLSNSLTEISFETFDKCKKLLFINIPNSVTSINARAFNGCISLNKVKLGNSVKYIRKEAFKGCTSLSSINMPSSVYDIDECAFENCSNLKTVNFSESLNGIWVAAFKNSGLESIVIPSSVTMLANSAFEGCKNLKSITFKKKTPPKIGSFTFNGVPSNCTVYVPKGSLAAYRASALNKWFSNIVEKP